MLTPAACIDKATNPPTLNLETVNAYSTARLSLKTILENSIHLSLRTPADDSDHIGSKPWTESSDCPSLQIAATMRMRVAPPRKLELLL